jgi:hypothetical protein
MNESDFNQRLKTAVHSVTAPPHLETRIRASIRGENAPRSWGFWLVPAGAAAAIAVALMVVYQLGNLRFTATSQESYIVSVSSRVAGLMRVGLGDHIHCAVFRKYPKQAPPVEKLEADLGPEYRGLIPIVMQNVPSEYRLTIGHQCRYHGRRFVHLSFRNDSHLLSLVIARKGEGESFEAQGLVPALMESGIPIYQTGVQRFAMDAFETRGYLVYFISDLPAADNAAMTIAMAPAVRDLLKKI